jgi:MFS family permease
VNPAETRRLAAIIAASLLARLPDTMIGLVIVLLMRDTDHGYATTGVVAGAEVLGAGLGQPLLGRVADRVGAKSTLCVSAIASAVTFFALAWGADHWNLALLIGVSAVAGILLPPVSGVLRSQISRIVPEERLSAVYTLESASLEVAFVIGPTAVVLLLLVMSSAATLIVSTVLMVAGTFAFVVVARPERIVHDGPRSSPLVIPGVLVLLAIAFAAGVTFGGIELGATAAMEDLGHRDAAGIVLAAWAAGSMAGGLVFAKWPRSTADERVWVLLVIGGFLSIPPAFVAGWPVVLSAAVFLQGFSIAPSIGALYEILQRAIPDSGLTEGFGWAVAAILAGFATGTAVSGPLISEVGTPTAFLVAAAGGLAGGELARRRRPARQKRRTTR